MKILIIGQFAFPFQLLNLLSITKDPSNYGRRYIYIYFSYYWSRRFISLLNSKTNHKTGVKSQQYFIH